MIGWSSREWERWDAREGEDIEKCTTSLRSYLSSDSHRDTAGDQPSAFNICKYLFGPKSSLPWKQLINQAAWVYFSCQGTFQGLITLLFYYEKEERERARSQRGDGGLRVESRKVSLPGWRAFIHTEPEPKMKIRTSTSSLSHTHRNYSQTRVPNYLSTSS